MGHLFSGILSAFKKLANRGQCAAICVLFGLCKNFKWISTLINNDKMSSFLFFFPAPIKGRLMFYRCMHVWTHLYFCTKLNKSIASKKKKNNCCSLLFTFVNRNERPQSELNFVYLHFSQLRGLL